MQGNRFLVAVHLGGTLAANQQGVIAMPIGFTLVSASAVQSNAGSAQLSLGNAASPAGFMALKNVGVSNVPVHFGKADWGGALLTANAKYVAGVDNIHVDKGQVITWTLDFDGAAGTAGQNVDLLFMCEEG